MIIHTHQKEYPELEYKEENPPAILTKRDGSQYIVLRGGKNPKLKKIREATKGLGLRAKIEQDTKDGKLPVYYTGLTMEYLQEIANNMSINNEGFKGIQEGTQETEIN